METSQITPRLGLMKPIGTDSFLRQDFLDTMAILDGSPGHFVCTSTTKPTWSTAQAGRQILCTDTGQTLRWTGSAWAGIYNFPYFSTLSFQQTLSLSNNAVVTKPLGSITFARPSKLVAVGHTWVGQTGGDVQSCTSALYLDGSVMSSFGTDDQLKMGSSSHGNDRSAIPMIGSRSGVTTGSHALTVQISIGNITASTPITYFGTKVLIAFSE